MIWGDCIITLFFSFIAGMFYSEGDYARMTLYLTLAGLNYVLFVAKSAQNDTQNN